MKKILLDTFLFSPQDQKTMLFGVVALVVLIAILIWMRRQGKR